MTKTVVIMAGGTGGHVMPGLAIAEEFSQRGYKIAWLGTRDSFEARATTQAAIPFHAISVRGVRGHGVLRKLLAPWQLIRSLLQSMAILRHLKPAVVIGMGGYASGPGGLAAYLLRYPLVIHEQNTVPGMTNRILARWAKSVLESFPESFQLKKKVSYSGNPLRKDILALPEPEQRFSPRTQKLHLLILGGSQGARAVNTVIPDALLQLKQKFPDQEFSLWHQTGQLDYEAVKQAYADRQLTVRVEAFIDDMAAAYAWADFVICRAGATTVAELAAVGLGSILIPFPQAVDDHQTRNAKFLVEAGAGILLPQAELSSDKLVHHLEKFIQQPQQRLHYAQAAYQLAKRDAAQTIVDACLGVCRD